MLSECSQCIFFLSKVDNLLFTSQDLLNKLDSSCWVLSPAFWRNRWVRSYPIQNHCFRATAYCWAYMDFKITCRVTFAMIWILERTALHHPDLSLHLEGNKQRWRDNIVAGNWSCFSCVLDEFTLLRMHQQESQSRNGELPWKVQEVLERNFRSHYKYVCLIPVISCKITTMLGTFWQISPFDLGTLSLLIDFVLEHFSAHPNWKAATVYFGFPWVPWSAGCGVYMDECWLATVIVIYELWMEYNNCWVASLMNPTLWQTSYWLRNFRFWGIGIVSIGISFVPGLWASLSSCLTIELSHDLSSYLQHHPTSGTTSIHLQSVLWIFE